MYLLFLCAIDSVFTLATSELCQTGVVLFLKVDSSTTTGTSQVLVALLISNFENKIKLVWLGSKVASINTLLVHFIPRYFLSRLLFHPPFIVTISLKPSWVESKICREQRCVSLLLYHLHHHHCNMCLFVGPQPGGLQLPRHIVG